MIDLIPLIFYGIVCTVLAAVVPQGVKLWVRAAIGAIVGIGAAFALPILRGTIGI
ncbi:hypothetical protein JANAI62_12070 [Jannaschia pagri]|uniref:Uncharacterized protein n=1 Tax=Jannaschia pagri TaxID=2829797 RepID=A0ABQ4NJI8_9RHOB|nr:MULTISPECIES: hypothetical protein [unclassified Jannaschia]GIT90752.1 hypothetical protein JANAI61_12100 [Jannaschia sp. AI_61]GIT94584.1 hypothetical protein JANAI62_12070 [Jannaschia sp. AI_62]